MTRDIFCHRDISTSCKDVEMSTSLHDDIFADVYISETSLHRFTSRVDICKDDIMKRCRDVYISETSLHRFISLHISRDISTSCKDVKRYRDVSEM